MIAPASWRPKGNKYRNVPTEVEGVVFQSKREANRWSELRLMERAKYITDLKRQVRFPLRVNDELIAHYVADFTYQRLGKLVVEDVKSVATITDVFRLKEKLMKAIHGVEIVRVM